MTLIFSPVVIDGAGWCHLDREYSWIPGRSTTLESTNKVNFKCYSTLFNGRLFFWNASAQKARVVASNVRALNLSASQAKKWNIFETCLPKHIWSKQDWIQTYFEMCLAKICFKSVFCWEARRFSDWNENWQQVSTAVYFEIWKRNSKSELSELNRTIQTDWIHFIYRHS